MNIQVKAAIIAIVIVIPLSMIIIYESDSNQSSINNSSELQVIASFYPLQEFSEIVGQDKVKVSLLVPLGTEPHSWEPTIKDVQRMQQADLIVINGLGFENWVDDLAETNYQGEIVDTSNGIEIIDFNEVQNTGDPHIWLNPITVKIQVQNIANAFSNSDLENKQFYQSNSIQFIKELDALDAKIRDELSTCNSDFIAFHDAFSYFAKEYNLNQHTILASSDPHGEATAKTLENIITAAKKFDIKIIFSEEGVDPRTSEVIASEIGGKVLILSPLEFDTNETYISKMTQNLENLKEALCQ